MSISEQRKQLRKLYRHTRNQLTATQQEQAANQLVAYCAEQQLFTNAEHIALYLANDGELSPMPLIEYLWQHNKQVYLPVLHPFNRNTLLFIRYTKQSEMVSNRFGIPEPKTQCQDIQIVANLDIIFTPLVAFDHHGNRMGMGGGFYDRTLANMRDKHKPQLFGLAHDCQACEQLPTESWDVPLTSIVTPTRIVEC